MRDYLQSRENKLNLISYLIILSIVFILIFNIMFYHPILGYDGEAHDSYIDHISRYLPDSLNLPLKENTREFFNPPIAYLFPSFIQVACRNLIEAENLLMECKPYYNKITQIFQALLYLLTLLINMTTIKSFLRSKKLINLNYLILVAILAVNYRTISMIRGEVYILFFMSLLINRFLKLYKQNYKTKKLDLLIFGLLVGGLALSRQWAFLLFPGFFIIIFLIPKVSRLNYIKFITGAFSIGFLVSSWFYFNLFFEYGSFTSFNKDSLGFSLGNQPLSFYLPFNDQITYLFTKPIRPYFSNQLFPIIYADLWGDYWGYFVFTSKFLDIGRNQMLIGDYLARVNILSLMPSILILFGFYKFTKKNKQNPFIRYISLSVLISFLGFLWFLISYPELPTGDTIKATYWVQLFNLLIIPASMWLGGIKEMNYKSYISMIIFLIIVFIHNFSSYLSHFPLSFINNI
jgi:hypothetical protein